MKREKKNASEIRKGAPSPAARPPREFPPSGDPALHHSSTPPLPSSLRPAVFLDRDGTLNEMVYDETHGLMDSHRRPEQVVLIAGAAEFMRQARAMGYQLVVVTNQPGVAKGTLTVPELEAVNRRLAELLAAAGASWDALYFCPHHPQGRPGADPAFVMECDCRKPKPGMLLRAAAERQLDLAGSWMVGDGLNDVEAGKRAGCRTILVTGLKPEQLERYLGLNPGTTDAIVSRLVSAAELVARAG